MATPVRVFFRLAFGLSWGIGGVGLLIGMFAPGTQALSTSSPLYYLAAYSVSIAGIALTAFYDGRVGLRNLMERLKPSGTATCWMAGIIAGYAAIAFLAFRATAWFRPAAATPWNWVSLLPWVIVTDPGPLGEEFGWRGFALPRLLDRFSPIAASLVLGLAHAIWHLPLFFIPAMPQSRLSLPIFAIGVVSIAIFDTALYLRSGANLLLAIVVHLMANVCATLSGRIDLRHSLCCKESPPFGSCSQES